MRPAWGLVITHTPSLASIDPSTVPQQDRQVRTGVVLSLLLLASCKTDAAPAPEPPVPMATPEPEATMPSSPVISESGLDTSAEAIGSIRQGMTADAVVAALGEPDGRPEFELEDATGDFVAGWAWTAKDMVVSMAATDASGTNATVSGIGCGANCPFDLPWGLKIGSTRAEVEAIYGEHFDPDFTNEHTFVAGSVYGGSFYSFEDGKVVGIFIGAGAE